MTQQLNIFLLLFGAAQGGLLSIWFLKNQHHKKIANLWFACFLIAIGVQLTLKVITKTWMMENVLYVYLASYKMPYLVGPLLYLYCRTRTENKFHKTDLLHFLPFTFFIGCNFVPYENWVSPYIHWRPYTQAFFQLISISAYSYLSLSLNDTRIKNFIYLVAIAEAVIICTFALMYVHYGRFPDVRLLFLILTFLIYWISYKVLAQPNLLLVQQETPMVTLEFRKQTKYAHSSLKLDEGNRLEYELKRLMEIDRLYLDNNLTIEMLSEKLKTSRHHVSQVLNDRLGQTYMEYISELRLEEAKRKLSNPTNFRFTIAAIAFDSGFNSVSSFNDVFKKRFGITPSKFRDQQLNKMSA
jgi:AraC-like DNA-binding protein